MENQKRHLELAVVKVEGDLVSFRITNQTHRGDRFCEKGKIFEASNGYRIASVDILRLNDVSFCDTRKYLPVSGELYKGAATLFAEGRHFLRIMEAVAEYNETNGKGYEKPWPQEGDKYFCFNSAGQINDYTYDKLKIDEPRREFGNFFRTREEAEAALERVKKALKGEDCSPGCGGVCQIVY